MGNFCHANFIDRIDNTGNFFLDYVFLVEILGKCACRNIHGNISNFTLYWVCAGYPPQGMYESSVTIDSDTYGFMHVTESVCSYNA